MIADLPIPPEKQAFVVWQSPGYVEPPPRPVYADDWDLLLAQAERSLETRCKAYPEWIESGRITREDAERDIRAWDMIAAEWRWIVSEEGDAPIGLEALRLRRDAVALSLDRVGEQLSRGNRSHDVLRQAHLLLALSWHLRRLEHGDPAIHFIVRLNRSLRARRAAARKELAA
jgi:hypothetical protein